MMISKLFLQLPFVLVLSLSLIINKIIAEDWDYGVHHAPVQNWPGICQSGRKQSPINIDTAKTQRVEEPIDPFVFKGYNKRMFGEMSVLKNNGHTIKFGFSTNEYASITTPSLEGGGLTDEKYNFLQAHLHWGATNDKGSEHTFDDRHTPMELHLVHWNSGLGKDPGESIGTGAFDALAVLSVHFQIGNNNKGLGPFFSNVDRVIKQGTKAVLSNGVKLGQFLPQNKDNFYRYNGSLTTPMCEEIVTWTIFKEKIEISQKQMDVLRQITYKHDMDKDEDLSNNFRPTQDLNGRVVQEFGETESLAKEDAPSVVVAGWGAEYQLNTASSLNCYMFQLFFFCVIVHKSLLQ